MKGREEMKRKIRSLLRENAESITFEKQPRGMSDYRRAYDEMEGMPASLSSPMMAGRPIGARISELPSESLRKAAEGLVLGILDVIDGAIEERGIGGAEVVARGITQGLQSRGLTMGMTNESMEKQLASYGQKATPEQRKRAEQQLKDFYEKEKLPEPEGSEREKSLNSMLGVIQLSDQRKADNEKNKKIGESALRREIRAALREAMGEDQPIVAGAGGKEEKDDKTTGIIKASSTTRNQLKKAFQMAADEMSKREDVSEEEREEYANLAQIDQNKELDLSLQTAAALAAAIAGGDPAAVAAILDRMTTTGGVASAIKRGGKRLAANAPKTEGVKRRR